MISCHKDLVVFNATTEDFDQEGLLKGNTQQVLFLQFDKTGHYCMTNAVDGTVLAWDMSSPGFPKTDPSKLTEPFDRKSCPFSWDTLALADDNPLCISVS